MSRHSLLPTTLTGTLIVLVLMSGPRLLTKLEVNTGYLRVVPRVLQVDGRWTGSHPNRCDSGAALDIEGGSLRLIAAQAMSEQRWTDARRCLEQYYRHGGRNSVALHWLARLVAADGDWEESAAITSQISGTSTPLISSLLAARRYAAVGAYHQALEVFHSSLSVSLGRLIDPLTFPELHTLWLGYYQQQLQSVPSDLSGLLRVAILEWRLGDYASAANRARDLPEHSGEDVAPRWRAWLEFILGWEAEYVQGTSQVAFYRFVQVIRLDPCFWPAYFAISKIGSDLNEPIAIEMLSYLRNAPTCQPRFRLEEDVDGRRLIGYDILDMTALDSGSSFDLYLIWEGSAPGSDALSDNFLVVGNRSIERIHASNLAPNGAFSYSGLLQRGDQVAGWEGFVFQGEAKIESQGQPDGQSPVLRLQPLRPGESVGLRAIPPLRGRRVIAGRPYLLSAWIKVEGGGVATVRCTWYMGQAPSPETIRLRQKRCLEHWNEDWKHLNLILVVPDGATTCEVRAIYQDSGVAFFDDILLVPLFAEAS